MKPPYSSHLNYPVAPSTPVNRGSTSSLLRRVLTVVLAFCSLSSGGCGLLVGTGGPGTRIGIHIGIVWGPDMLRKEERKRGLRTFQISVCNEGGVYGLLFYSHE